MENSLKKISLVIPCYNEESVLPDTQKQITDLLTELSKGYEAEVILVDDGSRDGTWKQIMKWSKEDARVHGVLLSRNFGQQKALTCGYTESSGDAVISFDADLQDDISIIPEMLKRWESGADIVYGIRRSRKTDGLFKRMSAYLFYRFLKITTSSSVTLDSGDFRLMSRESLEALLQFKEHARLLRAMVGWCGFETAHVYFDRKERRAGRSKYNFTRMLALAMDGVFSFSFIPLKISYFVSFILFLACFLYLLHVGYHYFILKETLVRGWTSLLLLGMAGTAVNLLCLGIIGEYVSRIYDDVRARPLYLVARRTHKK